MAELDLSNPVGIRAAMARSGLHDLAPYEDAERGWTDPLDDREQRGLARVFLHNLWVACQRAEKEKG